MLQKDLEKMDTKKVAQYTDSVLWILYKYEINTHEVSWHTHHRKYSVFPSEFCHSSLEFPQQRSKTKINILKEPRFLKDVIISVVNIFGNRGKT